MDEVIIRVLTGEVQKRRCPGCGFSLRAADVSAAFAGLDKVRISFRCRFCVFEGGGEIELTPEIYREAAQATQEPPDRGPISEGEMASVREILAGWNGDLTDLLAPTT